MKKIIKLTILVSIIVTLSSCNNKDEFIEVVAVLNESGHTIIDEDIEIEEKEKYSNHFQNLSLSIVDTYLTSKIDEKYEKVTENLPTIYETMSERVKLGNDIFYEEIDWYLNDAATRISNYSSVIRSTAEYIQNRSSEDSLYPTKEMLYYVPDDLDDLLSFQEMIFPDGNLPNMEVYDEYGQNVWELARAKEVGLVDERVRLGVNFTDVYAFREECTPSLGGNTFNIFGENYTIQTGRLNEITPTTIATSKKFDIQLTDEFLVDNHYKAVFETIDKAEGNYTIVVDFDFNNTEENQNLEIFLGDVYNVSVEGFDGEEPWKDAYAKLLVDPNIQKDSYDAVSTDFSLYDLNNDNIPELICYFGNTEYGIYTFKDFEVERLFGGIEGYIKKTTNKDLDGIFCVIGKHTVNYVTLDGYDVNFYDVGYTGYNDEDREIYNQELWDEFLNTEDFERFPINYINIDEYIYGF